jgi:L-aminopeptidase/D-esterase-like protein
MRGPGYAQRAGIGTHAMTIGSYTIGALVVVNAIGDVLDFEGRIIAGARDDRGAFIDSLQTLSGMEMPAGLPVANTTLAVVATDAPLSRIALQSLARAASCAVVRRIAPVNTVFDGDVVFALSTAENIAEFAPPDMLALGAAAQLTLEHAILQAAAQDVTE